MGGGTYHRTMPLTASDVDRFEAARPRLEAIAYRLLGSAGEAEDAVQETFLRWHAADVDRIEVPEAWLTKVLTNLCLNQLASARARRETYVGQWLPEPLLAGDPMLGPEDTALRPVGPAVNDARYDGPECLAPALETRQEALF